MEREMKLELELKEAQTAYGLLCDKKIAARTAAISGAFGKFTAPEGTRLSVREKSVEFEIFDGRYANTLARLSVETAYNEDYTKKGYKGGYRFFSGGDEEVKFLPAIADFITIASDRINAVCKTFVDIDLVFGPKLTEARKVRDEIQKELNQIDFARQQAKRDAILDLMKGDGFVPLKAKKTDDNWGYTQKTDLKMKFDWTVSDPALIKIVGMSASGKSAKVEVSIERYDGSIHTFQPENVRMDNINSFISHEVYFRDRVEANSETFEVTRGLLL